MLARSRHGVWLAPARAVSCGLALALALAAAPAAAGPALFRASFILHAFGNDVTSGTTPPFTTSSFFAMPLGYRCTWPAPSTPNGAPAPGYCSPAMRQHGAPATGSGTLSLGSGTPAAVALPQSAFRIATTGLITPYYYNYYVSTYASFANQAAAFFAGGGPAAGLGQKVHSRKGQKAGRWIMREGAHGFGGAMGLLGRLGGVAHFPGAVGTYVGTGSWDMIFPLGHVQYATVTEWCPGTVSCNWRNPHRVTNTYVSQLNGKQSVIEVWGTGTPWTTGAVTLYATAGVYDTILHRTGYDTTTPGGVRNIQLVTPGLTHWLGQGWQTHTGHIGILRLQVPEPGALALWLAGVATLAALRCAARCGGRAQEAKRRRAAWRRRRPA